MGRRRGSGSGCPRKPGPRRRQCRAEADRACDAKHASWSDCVREHVPQASNEKSKREVAELRKRNGRGRWAYGQAATGVLRAPKAPSGRYVLPGNCDRARQRQTRGSPNAWRWAILREYGSVKYVDYRTDPLCLADASLHRSGPRHAEAFSFGGDRRTASSLPMAKFLIMQSRCSVA